MSKIKIIVIVSGIVGLVGALSIGYFVWHGHAQAALHTGVLGDQTGSGSDSVSLSSAGDSSISMDPAKRQTSDSSGSLTVSNGGAGSDLGQLTPNSGAQGTANPSDGSSGSRSTPSPFDPSTYAQYDKYKSSDSAMFADVLKGDGDELTANKKAAVYYKGWLTDGTLFDQSRPDDKGQLQPFIFTLGAHQVIPGWEEGLAGMKVGGVRLVIVPPSVGYGSKGQGSIPGNSVLIFQVQLAAVQ